MKDNTLEYYNTNADSFFSNTVNADMSFCRDLFLSYVKENGYILDLGCGSGRDSLVFLKRGFRVLPSDGSLKICKLAEEYLKIPVKCMQFNELNEINIFDGIWACASLLHIHKKDIESIIRKIHTALADNGIFYCSFKYGNTERLQGTRFYNDYDEESLKNILSKDFSIIELFVTSDVREERNDEKWINCISRKK